MRARAAASVLALLLAGAAFADARPEITVAPTVGACFDAAALAGRIGAALPDARVTVATDEAPAGLRVAVERRGDALSIALSRRLPDGTTRAEQRTVPAQEDCGAQLAATAAMVARAVAPVGSLGALESLPGAAEPEPTPTTQPEPAGERIAAPAPTKPSPWHLEISVAARVAWGADTGYLEPGALLGMALRRRRWGVALLGGADLASDGTLAAPAPAGASASFRRFPLAVSLRHRVPLPVGALELDAGALVALWTAATTGIPREVTLLTAHPGARVAVAWRFRLGGRAALAASVAGEWEALQERFVVSGLADPVATTPHWTVAASLGGAVDFF